MTNKNQEIKLADFKEVIADIAYEAGQAGYKQEDSRGTINQIIAWANEFTEAYKDTDWTMTDYLETVYRFTDEKLATVGTNPAKPPLLAFEREIFAQMHCSPQQHTTEDTTASEPPAETDSLAEILADTDKCETFGCIVIDEISNDEETPSKTGSNLIQAYQRGDCNAMLLALCGWSMDSLLEKYNTQRYGDTTEECCPECSSSAIRYDTHNALYHCDECGHTWSDK